MTRSQRIIDADAHVFEPQDIWLRYVDAPLREMVTRTPGLRMATARATMGRKVVFHLGSFLKPVARIFFNWPPILRLASK